jgi:hypothetical protein
MRNIILIALLIFMVLILSSCDTLTGKKANQGLALPNATHQWAVSASASSSYGGMGENRDDQSPYAATGSPDVEACTDDQKAWTPEDDDSGEQWLQLTYDAPVYVSEVRIRESLGPGAVVKVELMKEGSLSTIWEGKDLNKQCPGYFSVTYKEYVNNITKSMTPYKTDTVRITIDTEVDPWNEIDAVELVGYDQRWYVFNNTVMTE